DFPKENRMPANVQPTLCQLKLAIFYTRCCMQCFFYLFSFINIIIAQKIAKNQNKYPYALIFSACRYFFSKPYFSNRSISDSVKWSSLHLGFVVRKGKIKKDHHSSFVKG